mmetsp:Transcript_47666/g.112181  ORF Transcript_47666/g.112181 Transcript_47666/m.112181 type:complete len:312 (-) Transcript_47666:20-955(-)
MQQVLVPFAHGGRAVDDAPGPRQVVAVARSTPDAAVVRNKLATLKDLFEEGLISQADFDEQRRKVLDQFTNVTNRPLQGESLAIQSSATYLRPSQTFEHAETMDLSYEGIRVGFDPSPQVERYRELFKPEASDDEEEDDEDGEFFLSPRLAFAVASDCVVLSDMLRDDPDIWADSLPIGARALYRSSSSFRENLSQCCLRIACRLNKGMWPEPNCTGEEVVFHIAMDMVPDNMRECWAESLEELPAYPEDHKFRDFKALAVEDEDVLATWEGSELGEALMHGPLGEMMRCANLKPQDWFIPFRQANIRNHE